jgi:hypothetical protein
MPDLSANKKKIAGKNTNSKPGVSDHYHKKHGGIQGTKMRLNCQASTINMGEL